MNLNQFATLVFHVIGLAALGSYERIKLTSGTLIGSCFVLSYALEMFSRYFCEKTETQLAVTTIVALTCPDLTSQLSVLTV